MKLAQKLKEKLQVWRTRTTFWDMFTWQNSIFWHFQSIYFYKAM